MKKIDYSKIKAMAESILECIGDESEGENPSLPEQEEDINDGGQDELYEMEPAAGDVKESSGSAEKKKKRDSSLAMMSSMLASKFK